MNLKPIVVRVFDTGSRGGTSSCHSVQSPEERTRAIAQAFARRYGENVRVEFIDLFAEERSAIAHVWEVIVAQDLGLPVITIDGEVVMSGELSYAKLSRRLDQVMANTKPAQ